MATTNSGDPTITLLYPIHEDIRPPKTFLVVFADSGIKKSLDSRLRRVSSHHYQTSKFATIQWDGADSRNSLKDTVSSAYTPIESASSGNTSPPPPPTNVVVPTDTRDTYSYPSFTQSSSFPIAYSHRNKTMSSASQNVIACPFTSLPLQPPPDPAQATEPQQPCLPTPNCVVIRSLYNIYKPKTILTLWLSYPLPLPRPNSNKQTNKQRECQRAMKNEFDALLNNQTWYLQGTLQSALHIQRGNDFNLPMYSTVDWAGDNVLLDEDMVAHLSDFGISKLLGDAERDLYTETLATLGYIAPEYGLDGLVSTKCDVYSYGIMLLETLTRRKPNEFEGDLSLKQWVSYSLPEAVMDVVDANLLTSTVNRLQKELDVVASIMKVALDCCAKSPARRTNMKDVVVMLQKIKNPLLAC
ncbi:putative CBL-interacting protein kinase 5-like isoform 1 [Capsicum annuum]|nr:putative CBL-interacting protein kinase 5-like isoform 1 [Capsicum annuum]